jgi:DhnA family fructose-bisphosphate aldolase class Ia
MKDRMWRFFRSDGKALILAFDHGCVGKSDLDPARIIPQAVEGGLDGILATYGVIKNFRKEMGQIGIMLRMDAFGSALSSFYVNPQLRSTTVEDAVRLGVDGLMCLGFPGKTINGEEIDLPSMQVVADIASQCDRWGLVSSAEMLPYGFSTEKEHRTVDVMKIACRMGAELGVDFIKTEFVPPVESFKSVVENSFVPILALGGPYNPDSRVMLEFVREAMDAGCRGVVMGRNITHHENIPGFVSAVSKIIHDDASVETAMKELD